MPRVAGTLVTAAVVAAVTRWPAGTVLAGLAAWFLPRALGPDRAHARALERIEAIAVVHRDAARHDLRRGRAGAGHPGRRAGRPRADPRARGAAGRPDPPRAAAAGRRCARSPPRPPTRPPTWSWRRCCWPPSSRPATWPSCWAAWPTPPASTR